MLTWSSCGRTLLGVVVAACVQQTASASASPHCTAPIQAGSLEVLFTTNNSKFREEFPEESNDPLFLNAPIPPEKCRTCACVGSSGIMLNHQFGAEIDEHDCVLRFNGAPTVGFEAHVGSKTTFQYINRAALALMAFNKLAGSHLDLDSFNQGTSPDYIILNSPSLKSLASFTRNKRLAKHIPAMRNSTTKVTAVTRQLEQHTKSGIYYATNKERKEQKWVSGMTGVTILTHICSQVTMYGFGHKPTATNSNISYHYYNSKHHSNPHDDGSWQPQYRNVLRYIQCTDCVKAAPPMEEEETGQVSMFRKQMLAENPSQEECKYHSSNPTHGKDVVTP